MTILCYGDSNTFGWDPVNRTRFKRDERWPRVMEQKLGEGYVVIEEGLGGRTTTQPSAKKAGRCGKDYLYPCMQSHQPIDLIILMLGTNDTKFSFSPSAEKIAQGIEELTQMVLNPQNWDNERVPKLLIISPIHISKDIFDSTMKDDFDDRSIEISKELSKAYEALAKKYDCYFMNAADFAKPSPADGVHLDLENTKQLGLAVADKVKTIFE